MCYFPFWTFLPSFLSSMFRNAAQSLVYRSWFKVLPCPTSGIRYRCDNLSQIQSAVIISSPEKQLNHIVLCLSNCPSFSCSPVSLYYVKVCLCFDNRIQSKGTFVHLIVKASQTSIYHNHLCVSRSFEFEEENIVAHAQIDPQCGFDIRFFFLFLLRLNCFHLPLL